MFAPLLVPETTVSELLERVPGAPRAFERHRVDYCCHGSLPLAEACARVRADVRAVLSALAEESARPDAEPAWGDAFVRDPLEDLVAHLLADVHPATRREIDALRGALSSPPPLAAALAALDDELTRHMLFEERHLFPYVVALERTMALPPALFASVAEPCEMLLRDHESTDHSLDALRAITDRYTPPAGADDALREGYARLAEFDRALVRHMHIEGNVLFPRAQRLEEKLRSSAPRARRR